MSNKKDFVWELPKFRDTVHNRIARVFLETDLRNSHDGLADIATKAKHNPSDLKPGELLFFVNNSWTAIKGFASGREALFYWRLPGNRMIPAQVLRLIPKYYGGNELPLDAAFKEYVQRKTKKVKE